MRPSSDNNNANIVWLFVWAFGASATILNDVCSWALSLPTLLVGFSFDQMNCGTFGQCFEYNCNPLPRLFIVLGV